MEQNKQTSAINCLHVPQGVQKPSKLELTTMALKRRWPSEIALANAVRSAQIAEKVADSMLQPLK